jgi:leucyl-tRNA synthetase
VAALMEYSNGLQKLGADRAALIDLLKLLAPFAPHIASELLEQLDPKFDLDWPKYDEKYLVDDQITIAVQVNGKLRGEITVSADETRENIEKLALEQENVAKFVGNKRPTRVIYVPGRVVNIVV